MMIKNKRNNILTFLGVFMFCSIAYSQGGLWTWMKGDPTNFATTVTGTPGVPSPSNFPQCRYSPTPWTDNNGDFWMWGGSSDEPVPPIGPGNHRINDLWKFDPVTNQWTYYTGDTGWTNVFNFGIQGVSSPLNSPPGASFGPPGWVDLNNNLWLYGTKWRNDMWMFNTTSLEWTWMSGASAPLVAGGVVNTVYGTQGIFASGNTPGEYNGEFTSGNYVDAAGNLWYFRDDQGVMWKYDITLNQWAWITGMSAPTMSYTAIGVFAPSNTPGVLLSNTAAGLDLSWSKWKDNNGKFWLMIARKNGDTYLWQFDPTIQQWACMWYGNGVNGQEQFCTYNSSYAPYKATEYRVNWVDDCNNFWFLAQEDNQGADDAHLWCYNTSLNQFKLVQTISGWQPNYGTMGVSSITNKPGNSMWGLGYWGNERGIWIFQGGYGDFDNSVWLYEPDTISGSFSNTSLCLTLDLSGTAISGCGEIKSWEWDFGDNTTSNIQNPSHTYSSAGTYDVTLVVKNCTWDTDTITQSIVISSCGINVNIVNDTICESDCVDIIAVTSGGIGALTYQWDNGIISTIDSVNVCPSQTTTYQVISTDVTGVSDTALATITVLPVPVVNLGADTVVCGATLTLNASNTGSTYNWQNGSTNQTFQVTSSGTYWVEVDNGGCVVTDTIVVLLNAAFVDLGVDTLCLSPIALDAGNSGATYLWQDGSINQTFQVISAGIYHVTIINSDGCQASDTVTVLPIPFANLGNDTTICSGVLPLDAGNIGSTYTWQDGSTQQTFQVTNSGTYWVEVDNGTCTSLDTIVVNMNGPIVNLGPDIVTCNPIVTLDAQNSGVIYNWQDGSTNQTFTTSAMGAYYVNITDANGCTGSDTIQISQGSINVDLGNDTTLCAGMTLTLGAQNNGATYLWQDGSTNQTFNVSTPGDYWVQVQDGICQATDTISVNFTTPISEFIVADTVGCAPLFVQFTDQSSTDFGSIVSWAWDLGDNTTSNQQNPSHNYASSGVYNVQLVITTSNGCIDTAQRNIDVTVYLQPVALFYSNPNPANVEEDIVFIDQSVNTLTWDWDFGNNEYSIIQNPIHTYIESGNYIVQLVVTNNICSDTFSVILSVNEELIYYVPNAFSPDGDEFNNTFLPIFTSGYDPYDYHLSIYNRWGEKIFESNDASLGWDGTYNSKKVESGVYTWAIDFGDSNNDKRHQVIGHVNVLW